MGSSFIGLFAFWRLLLQERIDEKAGLFDHLFLSVAVGLVAGRIAFILSKFSFFGFAIGKWVDIISYPGFIGIVVLLVSMWIFVGSLTDEWKDHMGILDYGVCGIALFLAASALGGGISDGITMGLSSVTHQAVSKESLILLGAHFLLSIVYLLFYFFLLHIENVYRTYIWYRARRRNSQSGFVTACFFIGYGIIGFVAGWILPPTLAISTIPIDPFIKLLVMMGGFVILYLRSGRSKVALKI